MAQAYRQPFYLSKLSISIIEKRCSELGIDFETYFNKIINEARREADFKKCDTTSCTIERIQHRITLPEHNFEFLQCVAMKNSTTISRAIELLLVKG